MIDILITGADGFLGKHLISTLKNSKYTFLSFGRENGDVSKVEFWESLPNAKYLIHLAGNSDVLQSWQSSSKFLIENCNSVTYAIEWAKIHQAKIIFPSSYIYSKKAKMPVTENSVASPQNPYALSKFLSEKNLEYAYKFFGIQSTVLRFFNIYGPNQPKGFLIPDILRQLKSANITVKDLSPKRDYLFIEDAIDAIIKSLNLHKGHHCFNVGSGVSYSVGDVIKLIQENCKTNYNNGENQIKIILHFHLLKANIF